MVIFSLLPGAKTCQPRGKYRPAPSLEKLGLNVLNFGKSLFATNFINTLVPCIFGFSLWAPSEAPGRRGPVYSKVCLHWIYTAWSLNGFPCIHVPLPCKSLGHPQKKCRLQSWTLYKSADCRWISITILCISFTNSATVGRLEQVYLCNRWIDQSADNITGLKWAKDCLILKYEYIQNPCPCTFIILYIYGVRMIRDIRLPKKCCVALHTRSKIW